jgi:hypothetical protein
MTAFMVIFVPVEKRQMSWRLASCAIVSWEQPRSDAVGRRLARRVVDVWEQLRSFALRAARGRHALARALPKGLQLAAATDMAADFLCERHHECKETAGGCRRLGFCTLGVFANASAVMSQSWAHRAGRESPISRGVFLPRVSAH